jgi:predicted RNA-binding protein with PUA-like domain
MARGHWLVKSEPFKYSWQRFEADGRTCWDGVRNHEARNNLAAMKCGDLALFYHSNEGKQVVGVARVVREHYPDPSADDPRWVAVDLEPAAVLASPVGLQEIKADPELAEIALVRRSRLSVVPITKPEFERVLSLAGTRLGRGASARKKKA